MYRQCLLAVQTGALRHRLPQQLLPLTPRRWMSGGDRPVVPAVVLAQPHRYPTAYEVAVAAEQVRWRKTNDLFTAIGIIFGISLGLGLFYAHIMGWQSVVASLKADVQECAKKQDVDRIERAINYRMTQDNAEARRKFDRLQAELASVREELRRAKGGR